MPRPTARPRTTAQAAPPEQPDALAPAPDTGVPFSLAERPATTRPRKHQLGVRVPEELWQRLSAVSEDTGVSITRLVTRAVEAEVARLEDQ